MDKNLVIIPNTLAPYGYEIVPILAYPNKFRYRFRFDEEWVEPAVFYKEDMTGKPGYIVLREFETGILFPIRFITVTKCNKIGKMLYIEVQLESIVSLDSVDSHREEQIKQFNSSFLEFHSSVIPENIPSQHMRPLVFLSNYNVDITNEHKNSGLDEEIESWGNILACFKNVSFFSNVQFLRLIGVEPMDPKHAKADFRDGDLDVKEGADYKLRVAQLIPQTSSPQLPQTDIELRSDNRAINILRGVQRAVGKYDILTFVIRVNRHKGAGATFLDFIHHPKPDALELGDPHLYIPVKIVKSTHFIILKIISFIFFIALYAGPSLLSFLPDTVVSFFSSDIIKDISIIGITISLISLINELKSFNQQW